MTDSMAVSKNNFEEDRISNLPNDVIECIMEFLRARDAARTCVLSSKWRYVWAHHPSLVLDYRLWNGTWHNRSPKELHDYANIVVGSILIYHVGDIERVSIDLILMGSMPHSNIDLWLTSLCRRGLKELKFKNSSDNLYEVPSCVFSASTLTHLMLYWCIIRAMDSRSVCFTNIQSLILVFVTLDSSVLTMPLLTSLTLKICYGNLDFEIFAPRLASLILNGNKYLNVKPFLLCTRIDYAYLFLYDRLIFSTPKIRYFVDGESLNMVKLLATWPRISQLAVDGYYFKYLATGSIPCTLELNNLRHLAIYDLNLDSELVAWILCILKNSPLLNTFEIWLPDTNLEQVNDIGEHVNKDFRMEQLRTIKIYFKASTNEVKFAKILLQCAPLLEKMLVNQSGYLLDPNERIHILKKLLLLQRSFPKAQIIFEP